MGMSDKVASGSGSSAGGSSPVSTTTQNNPAQNNPAQNTSSQNTSSQNSSSQNASQNSSSQNNAAQKSAGQNGSSKPITDVKDLGGQLMNAARNGASNLYEEQRNRAADEISALGETLKNSAQSLDGTLGQAIAPYAETAAQRVGGFADTLRDRSLNQVAEDLERFARQWPMAFMAAAVGVGFVAGRFLLSSGSSISDVVTRQMGGNPMDANKGDQTGSGGASSQNRTNQQNQASGGHSAASGTERAGYGATSGAGSH